MKLIEEELAYADAVDLTNMLHKKEISCVELMTFCLSRVSKINPHINAIVQLIDTDEALRLARQADQDIQEGNLRGVLHGLPHAVKDLAHVQGFRTSAGWAAGIQEPSLAKLGFALPAKTDDLFVQRMRAAGSLFIGKTNVPEFGLGSHTTNRLFGPTRNPYDLRKTAGGSSGGAAAALASGLFPLADGSDLGGSLRNPAAFCNVIGFRPSIGRVPSLEGGWEGRLATAGPMARSVRDVALLLAVQAGPDARDPLSLPNMGPLAETDLKKDVRGWCIGWTSDFGRLPIEPEVVKTSKNAISIFKSMGVQVREQQYPPIMHAHAEENEIDAMQVFRIYRVLALSGFINEIQRSIGIDGIRKFMNESTSQYQFIEAYEAVTADLLFKAEMNRRRIFRQFLAFFENHDFLVVPTTQVQPFDVDLDYIRQIGTVRFDDYLEWMAICCIISLTGLPAISMPCGFSKDGLPIGIQIIGRPQADLSVLQLAYAFEEASQYSAKYTGRRPVII